MKIWLLGMHGVVATTAMVGAKALEKSIVDSNGLVSELPEFDGIEKIAPPEFDFSGHEIRWINEDAYDAALKHWNLNKHYDYEILKGVKDDLKEIIPKKGTALNCGPGVESLGELSAFEKEGYTLREIVDILRDDISEFVKNDGVVINVASTEPVVNFSKDYHDTLEGFETMLDDNITDHANASMLYAYAALKEGIPYGNFTPSVGSSIPALKELAIKNRVPHAGNDGKTGETLVKTTIAPMFLYRNMTVEGWMSYNILGDDDGKVLAHAENKESKVISKDSVLEKTYGYSPYSICEIRMFPSLVDNKIAFDFVHFRGFLGSKMKFYFIWDGIDAILAAPLILDIARFLYTAKKRGEYGVIREMGFFFKSPMDTDIVNTHRQFEILKEWYKNLGRPKGLPKKGILTLGT
jgi:myo-inositol-1-phosphate synthase